MRKEHTRGAARVGFTMHELEYLQEGKEDWPTILNRLDLVLTPTEWNRTVWERLGVTTPIEVVPLGIDPDNYFPSGGETCRFLAVHEALGYDDSREDWRGTLVAYYAAFRATDHVLLQIKTWKWDPAGFELARAQAAITAGADEPPPVEVIDAILPHAQMRALYAGAALFIKNANREGWSLPCTEAAACATPIAATRIEPLTSHLPLPTRWFERGDPAALADVLRSRHREFEARRSLATKYTDERTCTIVSAILQDRFD